MEREVIKAAATMKATSTVSATARVRRGNESYGYFYVILAIVLGLCWTIIQVWESPWKIGAVLVSTAVFVYAILFSGRVQDWLLRMRNWYEGKFR